MQGSLFLSDKKMAKTDHYELEMEDTSRKEGKHEQYQEYIVPKEQAQQIEKAFEQEPERNSSLVKKNIQPAYISDAEIEAKRLSESMQEHERKQ